MQEQLAFPELQLSVAQLDALEKLTAPPAAPEQAPPPPVAEAPGDRIPRPAEVTGKTPRKRNSPPEITLVPPSGEAPPASPLRPGAKRRPAKATLTNPPVVPDTVQAEVSAPPVQAAPSRTPPPPIGPAPAANEQFRAPRSPEPGSREPRPFGVAETASATPGRLKAWAHLATIAASLVAVAALVIGTGQFVETQKAQRESIALQNATLHQERVTTAAELNAKAVELFVKYNELMLQPTPSAGKNSRREARYWKDNLAVNLLESLYNLTRGNREWETTVGWALDRHGRFIREQRLPCAAYSSEFVRYLEKTMALRGPQLCRDQANPG